MEILCTDRQSLKIHLKEKGFSNEEIRKVLYSLDSKIGTGEEQRIISIKDIYITQKENLADIKQMYNIDEFLPIKIA